MKLQACGIDQKFIMVIAGTVASTIIFHPYHPD